MLNLKIYAILIAIVLSIAGAFKLYFDYSQEQINTLTANVKSYKLQNDQQKKVFDVFKKNIARQTASIIALGKDLVKIKKESSKLSKTLARHELDKLASAKPATLKRLANRATVKVLKNLEEASSQVGDQP